MDKFAGISVEEKTLTGNNIVSWEGVSGDLLYMISAKMLRDNKIKYIAYVDLCGYPEKWWAESKLQIAQAESDNLQILELEIQRQLARFKNI